MYPFRIYCLFAHFIFILNTLHTKSKKPMPSGLQVAFERRVCQKIEVIPEKVKPSYSYAVNPKSCGQAQRHLQKK